MPISSLNTHLKIKDLTWSLHSRIRCDYRNARALLIFQSKLENILLRKAGCLKKPEISHNPHENGIEINIGGHTSDAYC